MSPAPHSIEVVEAGDWHHVLLDRRRVAMCRTVEDADLVARGLKIIHADPIAEWNNTDYWWVRLGKARLAQFGHDDQESAVHLALALADLLAGRTTP